MLFFFGLKLFSFGLDKIYLFIFKIDAPLQKVKLPKTISHIFHHCAAIFYHHFIFDSSYHSSKW